MFLPTYYGAKREVLGESHLAVLPEIGPQLPLYVAGKDHKVYASRLFKLA
jgi:hypothetical protein